jgi:adenine-specific DNA methylase
MKVLELFSGTGSISKVCKELGYEVISLDLEKKFKPDINVDILKWDYKKDFKQGDFDIITSISSLFILELFKKLLDW